MKFMQFLLLAAGPLTCSASVLPTAKTLPIGDSDDCGCVEFQDCAHTEVIVNGYLEAKNVSCKWSSNKSEANCTYERRFVADLGQGNEKPNYVAEDWIKLKMTARRVEKGAWCKVR